MAENRLEMWHMVSQGVRLSDFTPCLVHVSSHSSFAFYERKTNLCQALSRLTAWSMKKCEKRKPDTGVTLLVPKFRDSPRNESLCDCCMSYTKGFIDLF